MKLRIVIPDSFDEVTVDQHQRLTTAWENDSLTENEKLFEGVEILCGITMDVMVSIPEQDVRKIVTALKFLMDSPQSDDHPLQPSFTLEGVEYGFIPDWTNLLLREFVDLEALAKKGIYENLHLVMSIMYRPVTKRVKHLYAIEPYVADLMQAEKMKQAPMSVALGALSFFFHIGRTLAYATLNSSTNR